MYVPRLLISLVVIPKIVRHSSEFILFGSPTLDLFIAVISLPESMRNYNIFILPSSCTGNVTVTVLLCSNSCVFVIEYSFFSELKF